jgi:hypothetical protein
LKGGAFTFLFFSQKTQISEECSKDVKLASREPNDFIATKYFMTPGKAKFSGVTSRNDFIM